MNTFCEFTLAQERYQVFNRSGCYARHAAVMYQKPLLRLLAHALYPCQCRFYLALAA